MLKTFMRRLFDSAMAHNRANILRLIKNTRPETLLDLGCDDGRWTSVLLNEAGAKKAYGVEIVPERAESAKKKSILVSVADLGQKIPLDNETFDLVHANQVIEHVPDVDLFAHEIYRLLKPGGSAVISTENGSSWHNVFAAVLGWQIFSLTNMSSLQSGVGNPMALHRGGPPPEKSWTHKVIFNYRGLVEFFQAHGFVDIQVKGAGYYPLPTMFGDIDRRHAHFLTLLVHKPAG